jgi:4-amino-4-deoxy-L-arabinose transferase-like glycosyltransferase
MSYLRVHLSPLSLLSGAFIVLALIYAWATPIFEASDELWHFGVVNHIANTGELPVQVIGIETPWEQEGSQPPLYYLIAAVLVAPIDRSDFEVVRQPNPHAIAGVPGAVGNKNLVLHDTPHPALQGTTLAVYLVRLFSIGLGVVTVYGIYRTACIVSRGNRPIALLAAGLTAFNPMFLFITASVNNDNLITALNSLVIWQMLLMLQTGFATRRSLLIAVLLALASISKLSGLVLYPTIALAALWTARRTGDWRGLVVLGAMAAVAWLVIAGWWYARNLWLYGELFGTRTMAEVAGVRDSAFTLQTLLNEFQGFRFGYWGVFGAFNIMTFRWFYDVMDLVTLLATVGLVRSVWIRRSDREYITRIALLTLIVLGGMAGVIAWTAQTYASQGRLLFPYVAAISSLLAVGLVELASLPPLQSIASHSRLSAIRLGVALLALLAFVVPFASIAPEYAPPAPLNALPDSAHQVYARYGDAALVGYETPDRRYQPGDTVPITVYWQVMERSSQDLSLYLNAVIGEGSVIGKVDSYPGAGRLRTTTWQPGAIYADVYGIPLDETATGQSTLRIQVGWWHYPTQAVLEPTGADGQSLGSVLLDSGGFAGGDTVTIPDNLTETERIHFGNMIALTGYHLEDNTLTLAWEALGTPPADYTVFVQVLNRERAIIGQGDAPPPLPTHYWRAGERFVTHHTLVFPEAPEVGTYPILIGWYGPDTFERLATGYPDNAYPLSEMIFEGS